MKLILILFLALFYLQSFAQRKMPNISFQENSIEFANANRSFDDKGQFLDTLRDEHIIENLAKILNENQDLIIQLSGNCALNEDTLIAQKRTDLVKELLLRKGVHEDQLIVKNYAHRMPIISDSILFSLDSKEEKGAANQKNRRVEIKVVGVKQQ